MLLFIKLRWCKLKKTSCRFSTSSLQAGIQPRLCLHQVLLAGLCRSRVSWGWFSAPCVTYSSARLCIAFYVFSGTAVGIKWLIRHRHRNNRPRMTFLEKNTWGNLSHSAALYPPWVSQAVMQMTQNSSVTPSVRVMTQKAVFKLKTTFQVVIEG